MKMLRKANNVKKNMFQPWHGQVKHGKVLDFRTLDIKVIIDHITNTLIKKNGLLLKSPPYEITI